MNAVGIIAEYNPLHNGHVHHFNKTLEIAGSDAVVVAMSGNFVQRGEPAIIDKWSRAKAAVSMGASLVIEIPTLFCLGNAKQYASAAVSILESLSPVNTLSFGSECGDLESLLRVSNRLFEKKEEIDNYIYSSNCEGLSYPSAREKAYANLYNDNYLESDLKILSSSNDILGIEYIKACKRLNPIVIKRSGSSYSSQVLVDGIFQSATCLRNQLFLKQNIEQYIPDFMNNILTDNKLICSEMFFNILKYDVFSMPTEQIDSCPSGGEGICNKLKNSIEISNSFDELLAMIKSRRYTYTRLSRLCMQILLGINNNDYSMLKPSYIRVLAMNEKGRALLSQVKKEKSNCIPIITNLSKDIDQLDKSARFLLELDVRASNIYNLVSGKDTFLYSDYRVHPVIL